jgi:hypothetical protein
VTFFSNNQEYNVGMLIGYTLQHYSYFPNNFFSSDCRFLLFPGE